jgi:segregation and condensation protein B
LFLKLFGLGSARELPAIEGFDPSEEFEQELRDRLLRAGEARAGVGPAPDPVSGEGPVSARDPVAATVD